MAGRGTLAIGARHVALYAKARSEVVSDVVATKPIQSASADRSGQRLFCCSKHWGHMLASDATYEVVDCTPVPHCSLSQAKSHSRHWLSGKKGRGGNHGGWYYGEQLLLCATEKGVITGWLAGIANMDDRWMLEAFVSSRQGEMRLTEPELPRHRTYKHRYIPTQEAFRTAMTVGQGPGFTGACRWRLQWAAPYRTLETAIRCHSNCAAFRKTERVTSHAKKTAGLPRIGKSSKR